MKKYQEDDSYVDTKDVKFFSSLNIINHTYFLSMTPSFSNSNFSLRVFS